MLPERLIIDDRRGRQIAASMGLKYTGILGVLLEAKSKNIITDVNVKPIMDDLIAIAGFRIGASLYTDIIQAAGE